MKKIKMYLVGVFNALRGNYPHEDLERMNALKEILDKDFKNEKYIGTAVGLMSERYLTFFEDKWRDAFFVPLELVKRRETQAERKFDWEKLRESIPSEVRHTTLMAVAPRHPPVRVMRSFPEGIHPIMLKDEVDVLSQLQQLIHARVSPNDDEHLHG